MPQRVLLPNGNPVCNGRSLTVSVRLKVNRRQVAIGSGKSSSSTAQFKTTSHSTCIGSEAWQVFAERVSGEWDGVSATFAADGTATELPERYVPDAYRDWGVRLFDWQQQASMIATSDGLRYIVRKLMPTVGCEADAVAFTQETITGLQTAPEHSSEAKTILTDGSYSLGGRTLPEDGKLLKIETCLYSTKESKERIRVIQLLRGAPAGCDLVSVEVMREVYDRPYDGRQELMGCGGGVPKFAEQPRLQLEHLSGEWIAEGGAVYSTGQGLEFKYEADVPSTRSWSEVGDEGVLLLPLGVWSYVAQQDGECRVEVGWLEEEGVRRVGSRTFSGGKLSTVCMGTDRRVSNE